MSVRMGLDGPSRRITVRPTEQPAPPRETPAPEPAREPVPEKEPVPA